MIGTTSETRDNPQSPPQRSRKSLQTRVFQAIAVVAVLVFLSVAYKSESFSALSVSDSVGIKSSDVCFSVCTQRREKRSELIRGKPDLMDPSELLRQVSEAKERLIDKLKKDYGDYFEPIFVDDETGVYRPFRPINDVSAERLKRKLMIKVLSMQKALDSQDSDFHGCDCSGGKNKALRKGVSDSLDPEDASIVFEGIENTTTETGVVFEKYVWATGGHSAAAGHGNLYNESYTAHMESDLRDVFGSIGIDFEGRNYAMGGTASGTIVSMCFKEIFGEDIDFFSWDFGMTDGKMYQLRLHYTYRGGITRSRPAVMMMTSGSARMMYEELETMGLTIFEEDPELLKEMRENLPDSSDLNQAEIEQLPEYVRNYKCGTSIEKGEPFCREEKFSKWGCYPRMKQSSWHPGFKEHARRGHALGLFLTEALLDALRDLVKLKTNDAALLLSRLEQEDKELYNSFEKAELPEEHTKLMSLEEVETGDGEPAIDHSTFFRGPSMCHTARIPSQIRYHGILTDTNQVGGPVPAGEETYFVGISESEAKKSPAENHEIRLVYEDHEREDNCPGFTVKPDYPDSFMVTNKDGWTKLVFPNEAEKQFYRYDPKDYQGIIVSHVKPCAWQHCPKGFLLTEDYSKNLWEMKVNGQIITEVIDTNNGKKGNPFFIVRGANGFHFEPDENGQYTIEIKVNGKNNYLRLPDFVLY